ncbi:transposase [Gillisia sp. Hel_I_86]|uniref:IS5 family transposase n=1 Tax=Gillisia sp. Hel_I_86 TaxID=1249981 RepID=UPI00119BE3FC|nr:IS5 family transposase [Gillisia sp. Hel_I_86]TVZ26653.1 transposase [Gillisia sp. Hel_I_86]TVZ27484.1 transposase [Gillisia sp. Hel_I_86]
MKSRYTRSTAQQWEIMKKFLPVKIKGHYKLRDIADAILWIFRTGCQWRNLPECFPKWESVYYHFRKWGRDGTLSRLNAGLNMMERKRQGKGATPSMLSIDSQSVKAGPMTSESKGIDGNKKIKGRKRHAITDTLGLVWGVVVGAANQADGAVAERVVEPLLGYLDRMEKILADHAYKKVFMEWVERTVIGLEVEISSCPPSSKGFVPVKWRWVTERTFGIFNFFRRLDKDYEKTPESQEYWVLWQNCQIILNRIE